MVKTIRVSDEFHEVLKAHSREGETMEETLRRVMGGPDPTVLAEVIGTDDETAEMVREAIETRRTRGRERRRELRERVE